MAQLRMFPTGQAMRLEAAGLRIAAVLRGAEDVEIGRLRGVAGEASAAIAGTALPNRSKAAANQAAGFFAAIGTVKPDGAVPRSGYTLTIKVTLQEGMSIQAARP